jgi:hypothetical protein
VILARPVDNRYGKNDDETLLRGNLRRIKFQKAVAAVRDMLYLEESPAELNRAYHHGAVDEQSHVTPSRAFEKSANHGGVIEF